MQIQVTPEPGAPEVLVNEASVSGGGGEEATVKKQNKLSSAPAPFDASNFNVYIGGADGRADTQAGDHPYEMTTTIGLDNAVRKNGPQGTEVDTSVQDLRDVVVDLPLGFVGSTLATPQCPLITLSASSKCPADTVLGHIRTLPAGTTSADSPIYNVVPERGVPAEFGFVDVLGVSHVFYVRVVPTSVGYVLQAMNSEIPSIDLTHIVVTFYGDPAGKQQELALREGKVASVIAPVPFFTNPTDCSANLAARVYMDSWQNPGRLNSDGSPDFSDPKWVSSTSESPPVTGCNSLQFPAEIKAQPTTHESDTPSGMNFEIKLPQSEIVGAPATPTLKKAVVKLPEGFTVDPSAGDGLQACSEAQIGWLGGTPRNFSPAPPQCPEASKIGSLTLETPLIAHELHGELFLARQDENPFGTTLAAYVVVNDPITGVLIKIAGEFETDPHTGRLTAVFDENPNLPFSDLQLHFFGGPRAELATPEQCGSFTVNTELFPYSFEGEELSATPFDSFVIDEACPGGFSPSFTASSLNLQAGAYTPFVVSFSRSDKDQELAGLTVTLPPGLLANLTNVPLCSNADAAAATCPESTRVGSVLTGVGPGPNPLFVSGKAYLTGPYNGGPYGLAVVDPAVAGPFDFGTVVVRQSIRIDPITDQVTDVSDPFPTIIHGIPLRLRRVDVRLDRSGFAFNPTNCSKLGFHGTITGSPLGAPTTLNGTIGYATQPGASLSFTTPQFQVANCGNLAFKPSFKVSTNGKTSRKNGASLHVKLAYPNAPFGSQTNIRYVKVDLPRQLPSNLKAIQQACPDKVFDVNAGRCPPASKIGTATTTTPILSTPLSGPVYFVSHAAVKFPDLVAVLQGGGITIELRGETFIAKNGQTSTTFRSVPDAPVGTFEMDLPQGPFSALAAPGGVCKAKLIMPTRMVAQDGAVFTQNTRIATVGCPKVKKHKHKHRRTRGK
ncbi:MAG: hypothetical protein ACRDJ3_02095 [Solirubrobacteraceae bacterium]